jgi:YfiH family protein
LAILAADCAVVFLYDPVHGAIGLAHAGWQGTVAGVAARTVEKMTAEFGSLPAQLVAGVGPSIGPCCYEVGDDVTDRFFEADASIAERVFTRGENSVAGTRKKHLDLWRANMLILEAAGVGGGNVEVSGICTSCNTGSFYSYRHEEGKTGRFAGLMMIHGKTTRRY